MKSSLLKICVYFGSFVSQLSTFLLLLLVVRDASIPEIAILAIVDGVLLFLPFFFSMMSERTSIAIWYEDSRDKGSEVFATGTVLVLLSSAISAVAVFLIGLSISMPHQEAAMCAIFAASGSAIFNIQLQKELISEAYFSVVILQVVRGILVILLPFIMFPLTADVIFVYTVAIGLSCYIAAMHKILRALRGWHFSSFGRHFTVLYRMGKVSLVVLLFGFLLANLGRYALGLSGNDEALAKLLIYTKTSMIVLSALTPLANFLKPKIMQEYSESRTIITTYWNTLILASLFSALVAITFFDRLLWLWGDNFSEGGYIEFSLLLAGSLIMWLLGAGVDIFFDHSNYLKRKLFIYGFPLTILIAVLFAWNHGLNLFFVIISVTSTQAFILLLALFRAFPTSVASSAYIRATIMCTVVLIYGISFDWLSRLTLDTYILENVSGFLFFSFLIWNVLFSKR